MWRFQESFKIQFFLKTRTADGLHMKSMPLPCYHFYFILPGQGIAYTYCAKWKRPWENLEAEIPKGRAKGNCFWASEPDLSHPTSVLRLFCSADIFGCPGQQDKSCMSFTQITEANTTVQFSSTESSASQKKKSGNQEGKRQEFKFNIPDSAKLLAAVFFPAFVRNKSYW